MSIHGTKRKFQPQQRILFIESKANVFANIAWRPILTHERTFGASQRNMYVTGVADTLSEAPAVHTPYRSGA